MKEYARYSTAHHEVRHRPGSAARTSSSVTALIVASGTKPSARLPSSAEVWPEINTVVIPSVFAVAKFFTRR